MQAVQHYKGWEGPFAKGSAPTIADQHSFEELGAWGVKIVELQTAETERASREHASLFGGPLRPMRRGEDDPPQAVPSQGPIHVKQGP